MSSFTSSVALCTCNGEKWIADQLESILVQTHSVDEIIISDDASTDNTLAIVHDFQVQSNIPFIILKNAERIGSIKNFESAARACQHQWIFFCDQDDIWENNKVAICKAAINSAPTASWLFSDANLIDEAGKPTGKRLWEAIGFSTIRQRHFARNPLRTILDAPISTGATMAVEKSSLERCFPFPTTHQHDHWISLFLSACEIKGTAIQAPTTRYRIHAHQQQGIYGTSIRTKLSRILKTREQEYYLEAKTLYAIADRVEHRFGHSSDGADILKERAAHAAFRGDLRKMKLFKRILACIFALLKGNYSLSWSKFAIFKDLAGY